MHPLDNAIWHALDGPQRPMAELHRTAARYQPDVAPFAALPDHPQADDWASLAELVGPDGSAVLFRGEVTVPSDWVDDGHMPTVQMVATTVAATPMAEAVALTGVDVPDMLDLVARTQPGPFMPRTIELGAYVGVRDQGRLVAMAGERMHPPGFTEVSAVCTEPGYRGRGLAAALVQHLVHGIEARGERAFLHALRSNVDAIRLYEAIGFEHRRDVDVALLRPPPARRLQAQSRP